MSLLEYGNHPAEVYPRVGGVVPSAAVAERSEDCEQVGQVNEA